MAKTEQDFVGSIDNFSFYKRDGKTIVRRKGGPTREQIKKSASCEAIRHSNTEFSGASKVCRLIRRELGPYTAKHADLNMIGRFTSVLKNMISKGPGDRGARVLDVAAHADMLEGFEFNKDCAFSSCFKKELTITLAEDCNTAVLQTTFRPAKDLDVPAEATSFQLLYTLVRVPAYGLHATTGKYEPLHGAKMVRAQVASGLLYTKLEWPVKLALPLTLPASTAEGTALLCVVGVAFFNAQGMMDKGMNAMCVVKVG